MADSNEERIEALREAERRLEEILENDDLTPTNRAIIEDELENVRQELAEVGG